MNGHAYPRFHDHGAPRADDLASISPLQPSYNGTAFPTPYPDSTASSAPSEDPSTYSPLPNPLDPDGMDSPDVAKVSSLPDSPIKALDGTIGPCRC